MKEVGKMSKIIDSIIGHAVGDAMGVPTEFCIREHLLEKPVKEMIGSAKTGQPAGSWSDDTSMEIATIDSFIQNKGFDYDDIMNKWEAWINEAKYTPNNDTFDVGRTCLRAIRNHSLGKKPLECGIDGENACGNGSLMRILPVALYSHYNNLSDEEIINLTNEMSSLTHKHEISKLGCYIYVRYVMFLLNGMSKERAYELVKKIDYSSYSDYAMSKYDRLLKEDITKYGIKDISSTGYVVDTLECAIWILLNATSYKETILATTNIGNDTDTIGAVAGSMAGIIYGYDAIPKNWLNKLKRKDYLIELSSDFEKIILSLKKDVLIGTIIGDIAGSRFEIANSKGKDFEIFNSKCRFTDDSVMTLAVANAFVETKGDYSDFKMQVIRSMTELGKKYSNCGFGASFYKWIMSEEHQPYGSYGNGSAMRISSVGIVSKTADEVKKLSSIVTNISHNHPDSVNGAEAVAMSIYMALNGESKDSIAQYVENNYFKIYELRNDTMKPQEFHINCVETVKQSLQAFLESKDYEDAIRNAIAIGGDSDTIGAITGSIASAYYGVPEYMYNKALAYLDEYLINIIRNFNSKYVDD